MKLAILLLAVAAGPASGAQATPQSEPPTQSQAPAPGQTVEVVAETEIDRQVREIASKLRCVVCQGLSLQDSPSDLAQEMRGVIRTRLEAGDSPEEVIAYFESGYGEWILMEPKAQGFNLAVYFLPILAIVGGGVFLVVAGRRWLSASRSAEPEPNIDETDPDLAAWEDLVRR